MNIKFIVMIVFGVLGLNIIMLLLAIGRGVPLKKALSFIGKFYIFIFGLSGLVIGIVIIIRLLK